MREICLIGNSHVAALKLGLITVWPKGPYTTVDSVFWFPAPENSNEPTSEMAE